MGQLFVSRKAVKGAVRTEKDWRFGNGDEVLSRIFWLEGLELGLTRIRRAIPTAICDIFISMVRIKRSFWVSLHLMGA